jgi:hypothetical protein
VTLDPILLGRFGAILTLSSPSIFLSARRGLSAL